MAQTQVPFNSPLAAKVFGAAVFAQMTRQPTLTNRLVGNAPKSESANAKLRQQTSPDYPIVRVTDLATESGGAVTVDLFNILQGKPVMGDQKLQGRLMNLKYSSMEVRVDQMRGGIDTGGRMTRQRTVHDLRSIGRAGLSGWWSRCLDQVRLVHLAGARGSVDIPDWVVPLDTDPEFSSIMVNPVVAPTYNRHLFAGDATSISTLDSTDIMTLDTINRVRTILDEAATPLQPIKLMDDPASEMEPLAIMLVSPRQWSTILKNSSGNDLQSFLRDAGERGSKNPLFTGSHVGMWNGILVRKMTNLIRFSPGATVKVATSGAVFTETTDTVPAFAQGATMDRAIILGAQALVEAWGKDSTSGTHMKWFEREVAEDHGASHEASVTGIGGAAKLRFRDASGVDTDHGVYVLDSYAPAP